MKRTLLLVLLAAALVVQVVPASPAPQDPRLDWWREARFGLFIHWGLYAVPAGEWQGRTDYGEWIRHTGQIPLDTYDTFRSRFNPTGFDADQWVRLAKDAGMKYIVITTKHHDGFALWDSKVSDFDVMATPFRRDVLKELAAACQRHGIRLCFYHSIMDWHHPDYLPRRPWEEADAIGGGRGLRAVRAVHEGATARTAHRLRPDRHSLVRWPVGRDVDQRTRRRYVPVRPRPPAIHHRQQPRGPRGRRLGTQQGAGPRRRLRHTRAGNPGDRHPRPRLGNLHDDEPELGIQPGGHRTTRAAGISCGCSSTSRRKAATSC